MDNRTVDIRQLECLQMLAAEKHVTKAADRLGLSQPKLSSILARLRVATGDPLLVRTPTGMNTTPMAEELAQAAFVFLQEWDRLLQSRSDFSSATSQKLFRLQIPDIYMHNVGAELTRLIALEAPGVRVAQSWQSYTRMRELLETGEIDLAIGWYPHASQDLFVSQLATIEVCCVPRQHQWHRFEVVI